MDFAALGEAQAAAEKEKNRQKKEMESLQQVRDHARKIRQSRVHTKKSQDKNNTKTTKIKNEADGTTNNKNHVDMMHGADWTTTYRHFDDWEDPEELAAEAEVSYREENVFFFLLNNNDNNNKKPFSTFVCSCSFSFSCSVCVLPISVMLFQIYFCINMQALEKKRKSERERQPTSCNHDHAAERKVYEMDWHER